MPSNPTAHLVHLVHLLMATNQRMRSSFKILVALYRIFHTLFSSFFSGSSMVHLWLITSTVHLWRFSGASASFCSSVGSSVGECPGGLGSSARQPGDASCCLSPLSVGRVLRCCVSRLSWQLALWHPLGHRQDCFYLRAGSRLVTAISALHEVYLPLAPSRTSLGDVSSEWSSGA
jgi:hypothetical protein